MTHEIERDPKGLFKKGKSANPKGRPAGYQSFVDRAKYYMENYSLDELKLLLKDEKRMGKLSIYDGMILRRIAEAMKEGGMNSMNALIDRVLGKPKQFSEVEVIEKEIEIDPEEQKRKADEEANFLLNALAKRLAETEKKESE